MTGDEDLRSRLSRVDPMHPDVAAEPLPSRRAHEILERTMQTIETIDRTDAGSTGPRWRRPGVLIPAAAGSVLALVVGVVLLTSGGNSKPRKGAAPTTLALSLPDSGGGAVMTSCIMFDVAILRDMPVAFAGTVTTVTAEAVTLDVDRWYKGGSADQVSVSVPSEQTSAALDGVEFTQGSRYLVTATEGTVNGCGFSGAATAELESAYAEAFPG